MILKTKTYDLNKKEGGWQYFDGVKDAEVYRDEELKCNCVMLRFENGQDEGFVVPVEEIAYLLNDQGKTIDRIPGQLMDRKVEELHGTDGMVVAAEG